MARNRIIAVGLLALSVWAGAAQGQVVRSQCLGIIDYAHELQVQNIVLQSTAPVGNGLVRAELTAELQNTAGADFTLARAKLDSTGSTLDIVSDDPAAADMTFGAVGPFATVASLSALTVVLPDSQIAALMADLLSGALALVVHAEEIVKAAPGNKIGYLSGIGSLGDITADADGNAILYTWPPMNWPSVPASAVSYQYLTPAPGGASIAFFESSDTDRWFSTAELYAEFEPTTGLPESLRHGQVRVLFVPDVNYPGDDFGWYQFALWPALDAATDVASVFTSGSFCSTPDHHIDPVDGATRLHSIDGDLTPPENRNTNTQGIRFNAVLLDGVEVSGQVQGHAIKPRVEISIRPGGEMRFVGTLETDLSFSASLHAEAEAPAVDQLLPLYDLCFPLPPLPLGPIEIPLSLHVGHELHLIASLQAGVTLGLQKRVASGYTMGWDQRLPPGNRFFADAFSQSTPMQFTPPRLLDDAQAHASLSTDVKVTLNIGTGAGPDGNCIAGFGPYINASAAGDMDVSPADNPWWTLSHRAAISGGIDMELLGFSLIDQQAELVEFDGQETLSGFRSHAPEAGVSEGNDQRWAVNIEDVAVDPPDEMKDSAVAATPDGGAVIASSATSRLSAYDALGRYRWDRTFSLGYVPRDVFVAYDGTVYSTGLKTPDAWMAAHDGDGNLLWSRQHRLAESSSGTNCLMTSAAMNYDGNGQPTFLLVGKLQANRPKTCALRLDANGLAVWSKVFEFGLAEQLAGADTDADGVDDDIDNCPWVANADQLDSNGDGIGNLCANAQHSAVSVAALSDGGFVLGGTMKVQSNVPNAMVMRIDAAGSAQWASGYFGRARQFNAVTEAYDGSLYMTGESNSTLNMTEGAFLVARIAADGSGGAGTILFGDDTWETLLAPLDNDAPPSIMRSYIDAGMAIAPAPDGVVAVGHIGSPNSAVVGGVAVKLNSHLATEWHMTWDSPENAEALHSIVATHDGYLVTGRTNSFNADNWGSLLLMKLPFEGRVSFKPQFGYQGRYLSTGSTGEAGAHQGGFATTLMHSVDATATDMGAVTTLHTSSQGLCVTLLTDTGGISVADDCGDDDADGIDNPDDNCTLVANPSQRDTDGDGFGNDCDPDFNNSGTVDFGDLAYLKSKFLSSDPDADLNGDGSVNFGDLVILKQMFLGPPGPAG